jgi:hypothetical protein
MLFAPIDGRSSVNATVRTASSLASMVIATSAPATESATVCASRPPADTRSPALPFERFHTATRRLPSSSLPASARPIRPMPNTATSIPASSITVDAWTARSSIVFPTRPMSLEIGPCALVRLRRQHPVRLPVGGSPEVPASRAAVSCAARPCLSARGSAGGRVGICHDHRH